MNKVINKKYIINFIFYIKNKVQGNVTAKDVWTGPYLLNFYDKGNTCLDIGDGGRHCLDVGNRNKNAGCDGNNNNQKVRFA